MRHARRALAIVALALVVASCASAGRAGVRVDQVQASIVFGVKPVLPGPIAVPGTPSYAGLSSPPPPLRVPTGSRIDELPVTAVAGSCPQAPIGAAPEAAASENASQPPAIGLYRYKISGTQTTSVSGTTIDSELHGFEPHLIRNVQRTSETLWSYDVVTPSASGGTDVTTWSVNTDAVQASRNTIVAKEATVGEPARGIAIAAVNSYDGNGNNIATFRPAPAILEMPLPVVSGSDFQGVGVDSKSGQTEQVSGIVKTRQSVDACGTLVDGWITHLDSATVSRSEDDVFSTDLGGLLISQHIVETQTNGSGSVTLDVTYSLGQTTPSEFAGGTA
jgi:hypothetical protein